MALKLKSILNRAHWSLLLKAGVFGGSWFLLTDNWWLFFILALYLFFTPLFQPPGPFPIFIFLLVFSYILVSFSFSLIFKLFSALFLSISFFLFLGIREFVFIHRRTAVEILSLLYIFLSTLIFFNSFLEWNSIDFLLASFLLAFLAFYLFKFNIQNEEETRSTEEILFYSSLSSFLMWQFWLVLIFLPLLPLAQAALSTMAFLVILDLCVRASKMGKVKIVGELLSFFLVVVFVFFTTKWTL